PETLDPLPSHPTVGEALALKANVADLGTAAAADVTDFATAAQGETADANAQAIAELPSTYVTAPGARRFAPRLGASTNWETTGTYPGPVSTSYIDMDLARMKALGVEVVTYIAHLHVNANGDLYISEGLSNFTYAC